MTDARAYRVNRATGISKGAFADTLATARGALTVNDPGALYERWLADGRVFQTGNAAIATSVTGSAAGTAIVATAPTLRYTVPAGLTVVPVSVQIAYINVSAKRNSFAVMTSDTDTYTSGGLAGSAVRNMLTESNAAYRTSSVTNVFNSDTTLVEAALTRPRMLKHGLTNNALLGESFEYNILKGDPMTVLTGAASFLVWLVQETTAAEFFYTMTWAELDTTEYGA